MATDAAAAYAHAKKATGGWMGEGVRGLDLDSRCKDEDEGFEEESRAGSGAEEGDDDEPLLRARRLLAAFSGSGLYSAPFAQAETCGNKSSGPTSFSAGKKK